jgi:hypothetical protein
MGEIISQWIETSSAPWLKLYYKKKKFNLIANQSNVHQTTNHCDVSNQPPKAHENFPTPYFIWTVIPS